MGSADSRPPLVLDTNVFVSAGFNLNSRSARIIDEAEEGHWRIVWDEATRRETTHILAQIPPLAHVDAGTVFRPEDEFTGETYPERFAAVPDPDDRKFAALAAAAGATLVTNDDDLLSVRDLIGVEVLTPRELGRKYGGTGEA